jgi:hypothetical protein
LITYDPDHPAAGETIPAAERTAVQTIVASIEAQVRKAAQTAPARRDAHPKAHGCVRAEFRVLDNLPVALRVGIFEQPRSYQALIRFSNGSGTPQDDKVGDGRGMAVKLLGVEKSRSTTQDFIMINHPAFFVRNAADYVDFQTASPQWRFFFPGWNPLRWRLHEFLVARAITSHKLYNPLDSRYWSMTPYLFGNTPGKFSATPAGPVSPYHDTTGPDFLHDNLVRHLASGPAEFNFMVQLRGNAATMPIEDPTIEWAETEAPFVSVARIVIPQQDFDDVAQRELGETLSFSPWHGLDAHRPLGGINRVRRTVYDTISRIRHELRGVERVEPAHL